MGADAGWIDAGQQDGGWPTDAGSLDLNDVSFLFPLPASIAQAGQLLSLTATGPRGALLPRALFDEVLYSAPGHTPDQLYDSLRVVSVRFDPCFPRGPSGTGGCSKQIRLVAQPVVAGGGVPVVTIDAPIHLLYELTDAAFGDAHHALFELKAMSRGLTEGRPLDVHPVMRAEGLEGPYARKLIEVVLAHCGEQNLVRIATMSLVTDFVEWRFAAVDLSGSTVTPVPIARLTPSASIQAVVAFGTPEEPAMNLNPSPTKDGFETLLDVQQLPLMTAAELESGIAAALVLENPDRKVVHDLDCGSCHLATRARALAEQQLGGSSADFPASFRAHARFDLRRVDPSMNDLRIMRAFGYFGPSGAWSQRTINESARVAELLSVRGR